LSDGGGSEGFSAAVDLLSSISALVRLFVIGVFVIGVFVIGVSGVSFFCAIVVFLRGCFEARRK
jgi:hypothetical protein